MNRERYLSLMRWANDMKSRKCVICGMTNMAYKRKDGVYVVPITELGP